ncbi:unnamed protein product [Dovyalis caffra]|uniref:Uncharacterized protein n=1 Tax=Dovyalis caffra TaxID=77055 RepID=A0AAV1QZL8_9ROSI|nr:unnamed protein product [Dovyalis caffra]
MGSRVPVQHYNLRSADSFIATDSPNDLNTVDSRPSNIDSISAGADHPLNADDDSDAVDCIHDSYRNSLPLHSVGVEEDHTSLENSGSSGGAYDILTIQDVSPIETARARFLQIIVDHFISDHVIEVADNESEYAGNSRQDKLTKRKSGDVQYEGDPRFALPLMYVANVYETLVNDVNMRLASLNGIRDKTIGVALEAAGGLYRRMAKKFPKKGSCIFKRRELATSLETRTRFPELVIQEEKRVRFVVVNGLDIVERPSSMPMEDAECIIAILELGGLVIITQKPLTGTFHGKLNKEICCQELGLRNQLNQRVKFTMRAIEVAGFGIKSPKGKLNPSNNVFSEKWTTNFRMEMRFRRLTGRNEVAVSARDYKFYSPRHKYRRVLSNIPGLATLSTEDNPSTMATAQGFRSGCKYFDAYQPQNEQQTPTKHHVQPLSHQPQFHPIHQNHHQEVHQSQHATHFSPHMPEIAHASQSPTISQHMAYLQPITGGHVGGRLQLMSNYVMTMSTLSQAWNGTRKGEISISLLCSMVSKRFTYTSVPKPI